MFGLLKCPCSLVIFIYFLGKDDILQMGADLILRSKTGQAEVVYLYRNKSSTDRPSVQHLIGRLDRHVISRDD